MNIKKWYITTKEGKLLTFKNRLSMLTYIWDHSTNILKAGYDLVSC